MNELAVVNKGLDPEAVQVLKDSILKGASEGEIQGFLAVAKASGLSPLMRQIAAVRRWDSKERREVLTPMVTIDGARLLADRTGVYEGQVGPEWCGLDGVWRDVWLVAEAPSAARVGVLRRGFRGPLWAVAHFAEYASFKDGRPMALWASKPALMLAKCAEALALRKAFPAEMSGLYAAEEFGKSADGGDDEEPRAVRAEVVQGPRGRGRAPAPLALTGPTVDAPASPQRVESQEAREIARPAPKAAAEDDVELRKKLRGHLYSLVAQKHGRLDTEAASVKARAACNVASVKDATNAQLQHGIAVLSALPDHVEPKAATASQPAAHRAPAEPYTAAAGVARGLSPATAEKLATALGDDKVSLAELVKVRSRQELSAAKAAVGIPAGSAAKDAAEGRLVVMALSVLAPKADVPPASPPTRAEVLALKLGGSPEAVKLGAELAAAEAGRTPGSAAGDFSARAGDLLACRLQPAAFEALMAAHPGLMEEDPVTLRTVLAFVDAAPDAAGAPLAPQKGA